MNRKLLASAICAGLFMAGAAYAHAAPAPAAQPQDQTTTDQSNDQNQNAKEMETITVTGSLLKRPEYETTAPVQVVDMEAGLAAGAFDTADLLQSTAVASGSTQINGQFGGFVIDGGTGVKPIDLRGLGANRTLVLLDGQRPGPAGTKGAVGAFDLNVIPSVALGRIEIVKDGSSSIYGSDAISGVVNLITRKSIDGVELKADLSVPQHGGGEQATASIGTGWDFDRGHALVAVQVQQQYPLAAKDRSFLNCSRDIAYGPNGNRIDRADHSILQGTPYAGCNSMLQNEIINPITGDRYVPAAGRTADSPIPGWRIAQRGTYDDGNPDGAYYEEVTNSPFMGDEWVINKNRNSSLYASTGLTFGTVNWDTQFLFSRRETRTKSFRQFFPLAAYGGELKGDLSNLYEPIMPYPDQNDVTVDYGYLATKLSGLFESTDTWSWELNGNYSRSKGTYSHVGISEVLSGDWGDGFSGTPPHGLDYFDPGVMNGDRMYDLVDAVGLYTKGETTYRQIDFNAVFTGDLFELPAGGVSSAFGLEYRQTRIDDQPDAENAAGNEWGYASAQVTKGTDNVREAFAEIGVPLLKGVPGFESLSVDMSGRVFRYNSVQDWDHVWKTGLSWQITPGWRIRGSIGTSYRAPGLYELYLGDQTGFLSQLSVDPCIDWQNSTNDQIKTHCAAEGIPSDYAGGGSSAESYKGGGKGFLKPETSRAKSIGFVWTPTFADFNLAVDYFDYNIRGEIATLDANVIVSSCYRREVYPNTFCDMFERNPGDAATDPFKITKIYATFINLNQERSRGYDLQMNYSGDYSFGKVRADMQVTYTLEDRLQEFDSSEASGFTSTNFAGDIGRPKTVGLAHLSLTRGNWTYNWEGRYVSSTTAGQYYDRMFDYYGVPDAERDIKAGWQFRHNVSVGYDADKWGVLFGIRNVFDKEPDTISSGTFTRIGNVPLESSQYDWYGRTFFVRTKYNF